MTSVNKTKLKKYRFLGLGLNYAEGVTEENEIIKGISLFAFGMQLLTIAIADNSWSNDKGQPYYFKIDNSTLYTGKIAIGIRNKELN